MGEKSKIQWTGATWNPFHGCKKVSAGCKYCYMFRDKERYGQLPTKVLRSKTKFNAPLKWEDPQLIFTCSWSDWFIEEADAWRDELWEIVAKTPHHTYQILTKRPERIKQSLPADWSDGYENVWLGISIENQEAMKRLELLKAIPAKVKFASFEPLIGPINPEEANLSYLDWAIIGGESGNETGKYKYRPCEEVWISDLLKGLSIKKVPVFVKQLGTHLSKELSLRDRHGGEMAEWPQNYQAREFPKKFDRTLFA